MPTRTIDTQTFEGEQIQCAKFVSDEPFSWKAAQIVSAECDYEFQMVAKSSAATSLKIQVGDVAKNQEITTDFTRFVIPFPSVTNDVDSLYITFPSGTYWLYNLQLERASTPSAWRPAPEDAEDYADKAAQQAVDDQTQLDVFNKLTNNGASQGIYLLDGQLYINGEYIAANTISGNKIHGGTISGTQINIGDGVFQVDANGQVTASNMNITGGSLDIEQDFSDIGPIAHFHSEYNDVEYVTDVLFRGVIARQITDTNNWRQMVLAYDSFLYSQKYNGTTTELFRLNASGFTMKSTNGKQAKLYDSSVNNATTLELYDNNGQRRVQLSERGLFFTKADGTAGNSYTP